MSKMKDNQSSDFLQTEALPAGTNGIEFDMHRTASHIRDQIQNEGDIGDPPHRIKAGIINASTDTSAPSTDHPNHEEVLALGDDLPDTLIRTWMDQDEPRLVEVPLTDQVAKPLEAPYADETIWMATSFTEVENTLMESQEEDLEHMVDEPTEDFNMYPESEHQPKDDLQELGLASLRRNKASLNADSCEEALEDSELTTEDSIAIHSNITFGKTPVDPIQEILSRNEKKYLDVHITNDRQKALKAHYVPSFLFFFITLLVVTAFLLYYTSTYI